MNIFNHINIKSILITALCFLAVSSLNASSEFPSPSKSDVYFKTLIGIEFNEVGASSVDRWVYDFLLAVEEGDEHLLRERLTELEKCDVGNRRVLIASGMELAQELGRQKHLEILQESHVKPLEGAKAFSMEEAENCELTRQRDAEEEGLSPISGSFSSWRWLRPGLIVGFFFALAVTAAIRVPSQSAYAAACLSNAPGIVKLDEGVCRCVTAKAACVSNAPLDFHEINPWDINALRACALPDNTQINGRRSCDSTRLELTNRFALFALAARESELRRAFEIENFIPLIEKLEKQGFFVSVRYRDRYEEVRKTLEQFETDSVDVLVLGGHGNPEEISFGASNLNKYNIGESNTFKLVKRNGLIVLNSCSTGKDPRLKDKNMWTISRYAARIAEGFITMWTGRPLRSIASDISCVSGREVVAPEGISSHLDLEVNSQGNYRVSYPYGEYIRPALRFNCDRWNHEDFPPVDEREKANLNFDLFGAATGNDLERVNACIAAGADLNKANQNGWTPIMQASDRGHLEMVKALINAGADLNKAERTGWTPIILASYHDHLEMVKALISAGADLNKAERTGRTAVWHATNKGHLEIVKALIDAGALS
jgi:hypothetical protein